MSHRCTGFITDLFKVEVVLRALFDRVLKKQSKRNENGRVEQ